MNRFRISSVVIMFLVSAQILFGKTSSQQEERFVSKSIPGLTDFVTLDIYEDRYGFLWFTTEAGLYRYGGQRAIAFQYEPGDITSLTSNVVHEIFEDSKGYLWITANQAGVNRVNPLTGKVTRFLHTPNDTTSINHNRVSEVFESRAGDIWLQTPKGMNRLRQNAVKGVDTEWNIARITSESFYRKREFFALSPSVRNRSLVFGWQEGFKLYDPVGNQFYIAQADTIITHAEHALTVSRTSDWSEHLWLLDERKQLYKVYRDSIHYEQWDLSTVMNEVPYGTIREIHLDGPTTLWVLTRGFGLFRIETESFEITRFHDTGENDRSLSGNMCYAIRVDSDQNVWVSTENGIQLLERHKRLFKHIIPVLEQEESGANRINCIYQDRTGRIWLGGYLQLHWYFPNRDSIVPQIHRRILPPKMQNELVRTMYQDTSGRYWFGMMNAPLWYADSSLRNFNSIDRHFGQQTLVRNITPDGVGSLWFGVDFNRGKLLRLNLEYLEPTVYRAELDEHHTLSSDHITRVFIDSRNRYWIGTWGGGVNLFNPNTGESKRYQHKPGESQSLSNNLITDIQETADGTIWIGTWSDGLNRVVESKKSSDISFKRYTEEHGLPSNNIICLLPDSSNRLWIATDASITMYAQTSDVFKSYSAQHGIGNSEFLMGAREIDHAGRMYFGGTEGVTSFYPDSISQQPDSITVYLSEFRVFNQPVLYDTLVGFKDKFLLSYDENFVTIAFGAMEYLEPQKVEYAYRLLGLDSTWIPAEGRQFVNFTHLPYGEYKFQVRARKHSSKWQGFRSVDLIVTPPFWLETWFLIMSGVFILGLLGTGIWVASRYRLKRRIQALKVQQQLQTERERISRELHDHVGAKLTNMVTGLEIVNLHTKKGKQGSAIERINQLEAHARSTINDLRQTIWSLKYNASSVSLLVEQIREFIHEQLQLRGERTVRCDYDEKYDFQLTPLQALNLFRISQEAVMNAVKYANADLILVQICTNRSDELRLAISDNGTGFDVEDKKMESGSFGLLSMEQRAEKISAEFRIRSEVGRGTEVRVTLQFEYSPDKI